jgi:hypothetical protein
VSTNSDHPFADRITATKEGFLAWHEERYIFEITEMLCGILERDSVKRSELADRLGKTKGWVTQALGGANLTARTIADLFTVLGYEIHPVASRLEQKSEHAFATYSYDLPQEWQRPWSAPALRVLDIAAGEDSAA